MFNLTNVQRHDPHNFSPSPGWNSKQLEWQHQSERTQVDLVGTSVALKGILTLNTEYKRDTSIVSISLYAPGLDQAWLDTIDRTCSESNVDRAENIFDVDARLVPPPIQERSIKVKLRYIGYEAPRIAFDPERD